MASKSNLGARSLRARKNISYSESESSPCKKQKLEKNDETNLEILYKNLASASGKSTNLETIFESPKKLKDPNKSLMSAVKHKRMFVGEFYKPNKSKIKTRKSKAKKLAKLNGFKVPSGNLFSVDDVASILSKISDSEDEAMQTPRRPHQTILQTPVCATPKVVYPKTPESTSFRSGNMIVADDTHPDVPFNWSDVMSPEDLFNHSMSVLDSTIFDEDEERDLVKPVKRRDRRSGGFRDHLKGVLSLKKELSASSSPSFNKKLEIEAQSGGKPVIEISPPEDDNEKFSLSNLGMFSNVQSNESEFQFIKKRRISGVQKSLYVSQLPRSPFEEDSSASSNNNSVLKSPSNEQLSTSFTDEDGNILSETKLKKNSPEIVLKFSHSTSPSMSPLTSKLEMMNVEDSTKTNKVSGKRKSWCSDEDFKEPSNQDSRSMAPTEMMSALSIFDDQNLVVSSRRTRRRSVRLMPYITDFAESNSLDEGLGRKWVEKTPPVLTTKKIRRRSTQLRPMSELAKFSLSSEISEDNNHELNLAFIVDEKSPMNETVGENNEKIDSGDTCVEVETNKKKKSNRKYRKRKPYTAKKKRNGTKTEEECSSTNKNDELKEDIPMKCTIGSHDKDSNDLVDTITPNAHAYSSYKDCLIGTAIATTKTEECIKTSNNETDKPEINKLPTLQSTVPCVKYPSTDLPFDEVLSSANNSLKESPTISPKSSPSETRKVYQTVSKFQTKIGLFHHPSQGFDKYDDGRPLKQAGKLPVKSPKKETKSCPSIHPALSSIESQDIISLRKDFLNSQTSSVSAPASPSNPTKCPSPHITPNSSPGQSRKIMLRKLSETEAMLDAPSPKLERRDFFRIKETEDNLNESVDLSQVME